MAKKLIYNQKSFLQFSRDFNQACPRQVTKSRDKYIIRPSYVLENVRTGSVENILINKELSI